MILGGAVRGARPLIHQQHRAPLPPTTTTAAMLPVRPSRRRASAAAAGIRPAEPRDASPESALEAKWGDEVCRGTGCLPLGVAISSHIDGGNIDVLGGEVDANGDGALDVRLAIHPDPFCDKDNASHFQWFNFRVTGARGLALRLRIVNAGEASFPAAWSGYQAMASHDLEHWFRCEGTSYDSEKGELSIALAPSERDSVAVAYFPPYTMDRHERLLARTAAREGVRLRVAGETLDGHAVAVLSFGEEEEEEAEGKRGGASGAATTRSAATKESAAAAPPSPKRKKKTIWFVCRQHPGETQAEWFAEGLAEALTDAHNPKARALLRSAVVHLVPNACPDGSSRGHLRTNSAGSNLNREWKHLPGETPDVDTAPEAYYLTRAMDASPPDLLMDVHGDEELPHVFIAGAEGVPGFYRGDSADRDADTPLGRKQAHLEKAMLRHLSDFQTAVGYEKDAPGGADMRILSNAATARYPGSLAATLELPFKKLRLPAGRMVPGGTAAVTGTEGGDDLHEEWGPKRCARLGRDFVGALLQMLPHL